MTKAMFGKGSHLWRRSIVGAANSDVTHDVPPSFVARIARHGGEHTETRNAASWQEQLVRLPLRKFLMSGGTATTMGDYKSLTFRGAISETGFNTAA